MRCRVIRCISPNAYLASHYCMVTVLQIIFSLIIILLIILLVFQPRQPRILSWPAHYREILLDYVSFYIQLDEEGRKRFDLQFEKFLSAVKVTGVQATVEDLDQVLIGAAAVIPVFQITDWEYVNLKEILLYPGNFDMEFAQEGADRMISGMVGSGHMENIMILNKWELRQGFINSRGTRNTAIHEFIHLVDKMDGSLDGVPEILLPRKDVPQWQALLQSTMEAIRNGLSDIDPYGATSPVECFAVVSEYYFVQPEQFLSQHAELHTLLNKIFRRG